MKYVWVAMRMMIVTAVIAGIIYPLAMTGVAQVIFPGKANGSMVKVNGVVSAPASSARTSPRPSTSGRGRRRPAAATTPWSSASNLGPTSKTLIDRIAGAVEADRRGPGPHVRPGAGRHGHHLGQRAGPRHHDRQRPAQAARVAAARGLTVVGRAGAGRQAHRRPPVRLARRAAVNVLRLNLALDAAQGTTSP